MNQPSNLFSGLHRALQLAWKDCLLLLQSPVAVVFIVLMPVGMTLLTGLALQGLEPHNVQLTVALQDDDHGVIAQRFRDVLSRWNRPDLPDAADQDPRRAEAESTVRLLQDPLDPQEARRRVRQGELDGLIILPAGLSDHVQQGRKVQIEFVVRPAQDQKRSLLEAAVDQAVRDVQQEKPLLISWAPVSDSGGPVIRGFDSFGQAAAGAGVMFILLNCITSGGMALVREKRQNTLARLMISPATRGMIVLGKTLGVYATGVAQAAVVFGFGVLMGVHFGSILGVVLVTLCFTLVGCALGLLISALARREEHVGAIGVPATLLMTALGGGMFPLELASPWMQKAALLFPTGWAMQAYFKLMREGRDWTAILPNVLVLLLFATVFLIIGVRSLRWE